MSYSSYDHDDLEPASTMRIERRIYFESGKADLSEAVKLPLAELLSLRAESAAAEQEVFDRLKEQAAAWEEQAGRTLFLDKALEYARTLPVTHTANQWEAPDEYRHIRSNMVYQMDYSISENTRYDSAAQKSVPYSWTLRWSLRTNAPGSYRQAKIAGQDRKVFASREELDKYLNGRIKAHDHYFTEISPAIPKEYTDCFKVNGCLLPGYTIEGEEPAKAAALPTQEEAAQPQQTTATPERREPVNEVFSIFLDNRAEAQTGGPHGYWLSLPTTAEQVNRPDSMYHWYKELIALRKNPEYKDVVVYGEVVPYKEEQTNLMAYYRKGTDRTLLVVANYQHDAQDVVLPGTYKKVLMNNLETLDLNGDILHMPGYQAVIFEM